MVRASPLFWHAVSWVHPRNNKFVWCCLGAGSHWAKCMSPYRTFGGHSLDLSTISTFGTD
eukprot:scaffold62755_cov35-Tisochrysis_lutea.AAC.1